MIAGAMESGKERLWWVMDWSMVYRLAEHIEGSVIYTHTLRSHPCSLTFMRSLSLDRAHGSPTFRLDGPRDDPGCLTYLHSRLMLILSEE